MMININTMNSLEALGLGCSANRLERHLELAACSDVLGNMIDSEDDSSRICGLLEKLKPNSRALTSKEIDKPWHRTLRVDYDEYDRMLSSKEHPMYALSGNKSRMIDSISPDDLESFLSDKDSMDVMGIVQHGGFPVRIVYYKGRFIRANLVDIEAKEDVQDVDINKSIDISEHIAGLVPSDIEQWKNAQFVEVYGQVYAVCDDLDGLLNSESVSLSLKGLLLETLLGDIPNRGINIKILVDDIISSHSALEISKVQDRIDYLNSIGFDTSKYYMVMNVGKDKISKVIKVILSKMQEEKERGLYAEVLFVSNDVADAISGSRIRYSNRYKHNGAISEYTVTKIFMETVYDDMEVVAYARKDGSEEQRIRGLSLYDIERKGIEVGKKVLGRTIKDPFYDSNDIEVIQEWV